jgi:Bacterial protein of unknown function (DUF937)
MNLIKLIEDQLSGGLLDKLSSVLGTDPDTTGRAASAAVPTLLAGLVNLASNDDGVRKLSSTLNNLDSSGLGNIGQLLSGDSSSLLSKGTSLVASLFGDNMFSNIAGAIGRFAGWDTGISRKLIAFLAPLVLGKVASQWKSQGGTPHALTSMLAEQKRYIPDSMPAGYSLDDVPGWTGAKDTIRAATHTTPTPRRTGESVERAAPSIASWLLPLAGLLLVGFLLWQFLRTRQEPAPTARDTTTQPDRVTAMKPAVPDTTAVPAMPNVTQLRDELNTTFRTMGETFTSIKDAASAEAAAPRLEELSAKIDALKTSMAALPEAGRTTLQTAVREQFDTVKQQAEQTLNVPGLSERIRTLITQILRKLEEWNIIAPTG